MTRSLLVAVAVVAAGVLAGCAKKSPQPNPGQALLGTVTGSSGGVRWEVPKRWTEEGPRTMRVATYGIPPAAGDTESAECGVFYFGKGEGGGVDANISRWAEQFQPGATQGRGAEEINGIKVTTVRVEGTYLSPGGPMMESQGARENYALLGAIVEGPEGMVFFKLTGSKGTVSEAKAEFDALLASLVKQ